MKQSNYDGIASQLAEKTGKEQLIATLRSMPNPNAAVFIATAQQQLNEINRVLNGNFVLMEASCSQLEKTLSFATSVVVEKRSYEIKALNQIKQTEASLKESSSKNKELDLKILESKAELTSLNQGMELLARAKTDLVSNMSDQQKIFVLEKARSNGDMAIVDLVRLSGFDEQAYLNSHTHEQDEPQLSGQHDQEQDVFS